MAKVPIPSRESVSLLARDLEGAWSPVKSVAVALVSNEFGEVAMGMTLHTVEGGALGNGYRATFSLSPPAAMKLSRDLRKAVRQYLDSGEETKPPG